MSESGRVSSTFARRDRVTQGLVGVAVAIAALLRLANAPVWMTIAIAATGVALAGIRVGFEVLRKKSEQQEGLDFLLRQPPQRVSSLSAEGGFYELGVETEAREALQQLGQSAGHATYVMRDVDPALRARLRRAARTEGVELIVVAGPSKAGKSRTLAEGVSSTLADAWLLAPRDASALDELSRAAPPRPIAASTAACVIWLDDAEPFVDVGGRGLSSDTLARLMSWGRPVVVLGTYGGKGTHHIASNPGFAEQLADLLRRYEPVRLRIELSRAEGERLADVTRRVPADEMLALGEFLISAPKLVERYEDLRGCPEGVAVTRAAIDWRRAGLVRAIPIDVLEQLYGNYLNGLPSHERFVRGLEWATAPLYAQVSLLVGREEFVAYDYIAGYETRPIPDATFDAIVDRHATMDELAILIGIVAHFAGEPDRAERALRTADGRGHARGAANLGMLLQHRGDLEGALEAYRRSDARGDAHGALNLGALLHDRGDVEGAEAAYSRAESRGDARGAFNLGLLRQERGQLELAEAAYRRAQSRGDAALSLGTLLEARGDLGGAEVAYRRAADQGEARGAYHLGQLLERHDDREGAEEAYRRADDRGDTDAACNLGALLHARGDFKGAEAAWERAAARGDLDSVANLGVVREARGDVKGAEAAWRRAADEGHGAAAFNLAVLLHGRGDLDEAQAAYRHARSSSDPVAVERASIALQRFPHGPEY